MKSLILMLILNLASHGNVALADQAEPGGVVCLKGVDPDTRLADLNDPFVLEHHMLLQPNRALGYADSVISGEALRMSAKMFFWYMTSSMVKYDALTFKVAFEAGASSNTFDSEVQTISSMEFAGLKTTSLEFDQEISQGRQSSCFWITSDEIN